MDTRERFEVLVLSNNPILGERADYVFSGGGVWSCRTKDFNSYEMVNYNEKVNILILVFDFLSFVSDELLQDLKRFFPIAKILALVPERKFLELRDFLLDREVIDVMMLTDLVYDMLENHLYNLYEEWKLQLELNAIDDKNGLAFVSNSEPMRPIQKLISKAASAEVPVGVFGKSGTGKEVVARRIHLLSARRESPFVIANIASVPTEMLEASLFGYEKGAFVGALSRKIGFLEEAKGGTLFLDEICDMDLRTQTKLIKVLQDGVFTRLGGSNEIVVDTRIIIATNKNLRDMVERGLFREDLYYRLVGVSINMPNLSERGDDIVLLANYFVRDYCSKHRKAICKLSKETLEVIKTYAFPGNVRELKAMMELAVVMCVNNTIRPHDLTLQKPIEKKDTFDIECTLKEYEVKIISYFLTKYKGNIKEVAARLDISRTKIYNMVQENKLTK